MHPPKKMNGKKRHYETPVSLIGGGDVPKNLGSLIPQGPVICADGGADVALLAGRTPDAVFGDMDSINPTAKAKFADRLYQIADQNSTDFEKCLDHIEAPFIFGFGFLGRRLDHSIAALSTLLKYSKTPIALIGEGDVTLCLTEKAVFPSFSGMGIGILPWPAACCVSQGLKWELNDLDLSLSGQISSSNQATGDQVEISVQSGAVLVTLPLEGLEALPQAFGLKI